MTEEKSKEEKAKKEERWKLISILATVALTFTGYLYSHYEGVGRERRTAQLARVQAQLGEFYGPLFAFARISARTWTEFKRKHPEAERWDSDPQAKASESFADAWQYYIKDVQTPYFQRIENLLLERSHLMEESEVPQVLLDLYAHFSGYRVLVSAWKTGDRAELRPIAGFPAGFESYASQMFKRLKDRQRELIGSLD